MDFMQLLYGNRMRMVGPSDALPGRDHYTYPLQRTHLVLDTDMLGPDAPEDPEPWPADTEAVVLAGGCFWGIERIMWRLDNVYTTAAGYAGGFTPHPTYEEVATARTGHTESVLVVYRGGEATLREIVSTFFEQHDPTTANRQGNDVGTEYRSAVYWTTPEQGAVVRGLAADYRSALEDSGRGTLTTQLLPLAETGGGEAQGRFYYAEPEHQQYLRKNPNGYCNHGFNGLSCRRDSDAA